MLLSMFHSLVAMHIVTGSIGAITFWIPVLGRKGGINHRRWGRVFTTSLIITGSLAMLMSLLTLYGPLETHPHLVGQFDESFVRGIFGWMMLTTGLLTVNLAWYGWLTIQNKSRQELNRTPLNMGLQFALIPVSLNCALQGWLIGQPLMYGMATVGLATAATNLWFLSKKKPGPADWTKEHLKALVGAGISVYTAFMAFGSVRLLPQLALHPAMWAIPLTVGVAIILWHWRSVDRQYANRIRYSSA